MSAVSNILLGYGLELTPDTPTDLEVVGGDEYYEDFTDGLHSFVKQQTQFVVGGGSSEPSAYVLGVDFMWDEIRGGSADVSDLAKPKSDLIQQTNIMSLIVDDNNDDSNDDSNDYDSDDYDSDDYDSDDGEDGDEDMTGGEEINAPLYDEDDNEDDDEDDNEGDNEVVSEKPKLDNYQIGEYIVSTK